jgi:peptidoglycan/xylan/chitin deacetylase (PgdA/CDA1 family)
MNKKMTVVQCWDDGVTSDIPLIEILQRYEAKATFNLNIGLHGDTRPPGREYKGTVVQRHAMPELRKVYDGFTIANHTLTHPRLEQLPIEAARSDIAEGRLRLQQLFQQPVEGFAYPFGTYNENIMSAIRESGHLYARTVRNVDTPFPPEDPMAFHPSCHFMAPDFLARYEKAKASGVFYFWGHSYEIISESMWQDFESKIKYISDDPESVWADVIDLFSV